MTIEDQGVEGDKGTEVDVAAMAKELENLKTVFATQGNELGYLRQENVDLRNRPATAQEQEQEPAIPNYAQERAAIQEKMGALDVEDENYPKALAALLGESDAITAAEVKASTLNAATATFTKALEDRDLREANRAFNKENPDFGTEETQAQIREILDKNPMDDVMTAYLKVKEGRALSEAARLQEENNRLKELETVAAGTQKTGRVEVSGGGNLSPPTTKTNLKGDELDAAMRKALKDVA